jgi:hypothetical protein
LSRITDLEMKHLMIKASEKLFQMLLMRERDPARYKKFIQRYALDYCRAWVR